MKRKAYFIFILAVILAVCLACFTACDMGALLNTPTDTEGDSSGNNGTTGGASAEPGDDENDTAPHAHTFSEWETALSPSCTGEGLKLRFCECGSFEYEKIDKLGHTPSVAVKAVSPSCTSEGLTEKVVCEVCAAVLVCSEPIPRLGHKYGDGHQLSEATCYADGEREFRCEACGDTYTEKVEYVTYTAAEIYERAISYVGEIHVRDKNGEIIALGTGFVYTADGKIITNYHVIEDAYSAEIVINGKEYGIEGVLAYDEKIDLAILKVDATDLTAPVICKNPVEPTERVYAIGSPRGLTHTISEGIVTYALRMVDGVCHIQHDASITHGNSGGPLINRHGEVIGINTWGYAESQNLNFAVFVAELDNLVYGATVSLSELYEYNHKPENIIGRWLSESHTSEDTSSLRYTEAASGATYSIGYDKVGEFVFLELIRIYKDSSELYLKVQLTSEGEASFYRATYKRGADLNVAEGAINHKSFTSGTVLTYTSFTGGGFAEGKQMRLYSEELCRLLSRTEKMFLAKDVGVSLIGFGFESYSPGADNAALSTLAAYIQYKGEYNFTYGWYRIEDVHTATDSETHCMLTYIPDTGEIALSAAYYDVYGTYYFTYLLLNEIDGSLYYAASYSVYNGSAYDTQNETHGYISHLTFTADTVLTYDKYLGYDSGKDALLGIYGGQICDMLDWLADYLYSEGVDISPSKLGFLLY